MFPEKLLYTFSGRITPNQFEDRLNPQVLSIFDDTKDFPSVLIFREFAKNIKLHYHFLIKSTLKESAVRKRIKALYSGNRQYHLHPIAIGDNIICSNPKHNKNGLGCLQNAKSYTCKEKDIIYRQGYSLPDTKKWIEEGSKILSLQKEKLHIKIVKKYNLNEKSSSKTIVSAYLNYRQGLGHSGFPANKYQVYKVLEDLLQYVDPIYVEEKVDEYSNYLDSQRGIHSHAWTNGPDPDLDI